jgi:hypothetical protein
MINTYRSSQNFSGLFHCPVFQKNTTFRKLDLFPSSGEGGREDIYSVGAGPLELISITDHWPPEDGNRSSFRNVAFFFNTGRWKKSRKILLILYNIHHRQNPFKTYRNVSTVRQHRENNCSSCFHNLVQEYLNSFPRKKGIKDRNDIDYVPFVFFHCNLSNEKCSEGHKNDIYESKNIYLPACLPLLNLGRFFSSLILYTVGRTPRTGDQPVARPLPAHSTAQTQNKHTQSSMPQVRFEPKIPVFERVKIIHALTARPLWSAVRTHQTNSVAWVRKRTIPTESEHIETLNVTNHH